MKWTSSNRGQRHLNKRLGFTSLFSPIGTYAAGQSVGCLSSLVTWSYHGWEASFAFWLLVFFHVLHLPEVNQDTPSTKSIPATGLLFLFNNPIFRFDWKRKSTTHVIEGLLGLLRHGDYLLVGHRPRVPCLLLWELRLRLKGLFGHEGRT